MNLLNEIDRLEIIALMDNASDPFTKSHPNMRWNESQYRATKLHKKEFSGADFCRACNGLSLLMRFYTNERVHTLLFDTGPDEHLAVDNAARMGVDLTEVEAIVLSHGHFDHYGGVLSVLDAIGKEGLPVYSHPELFVPRAFKKDIIMPCSYNLTNEDIQAHGGKVIEATGPLSLFDDHLLISGEVPRKTHYEAGSPAECRKRNGAWEPSPEVEDERVLIFNLRNKGLCVFTACGHTGVVNATNYAKELTGIEQVHLVMGGFHLAPPEVKDRIAPTITDLKKIQPTYIVTGHCTGAKAQSDLTTAFADQHITYGVGTVFIF